MKYLSTFEIGEKWNLSARRVAILCAEGRIETWGRGVEKIFETCEELGAPKPEYSILGNGVTVRFPALQSAISNVPKHQNEALDEALDDSLEAKIIRLMKDNVHITQAELMQKLHVSRATVQRSIKTLTDSNRIVRVGGKRFGYWEIL